MNSFHGIIASISSPTIYPKVIIDHPPSFSDPMLYSWPEAIVIVIGVFSFILTFILLIVSLILFAQLFKKRKEKKIISKISGRLKITLILLVIFTVTFYVSTYLHYNIDRILRVFFGPDHPLFKWYNSVTLF